MLENDVFRLENLTDKLGVPIWLLRLDLRGEKVNKLNRRVLEALTPLIDELAGASRKDSRFAGIEALILASGKPGNFVAGADIDMIRQAKTAAEAETLSREGQKLLNRLEDLPFPKVALVQGAALGGGCELLLGCDAVVVANDSATRIGLPEVQLGLIPGMGGCVRLPRKVGLATALDMILTGRQLRAEAAYKAGLVEACLPRENFEDCALAWVQDHLKPLKARARLGKEPKLGGIGGPVGALMEKTPIGRSVIFKKARKGVLEKTRGQYPAPIEALDVLLETGKGIHSGERLKGEEREAAMAREARGFGKMAGTEVSRNLIRLFYLTEAVKKSQGLAKGEVLRTHPVSKGAVLGAGVMGGGIAQLFADRRIPVRMKDLTTAALGQGIQSASRVFQRQVKRRRLSSREAAQKMNFIAPVLDYSGFTGSDLVIEAVVEKMDVKKKVFAEVEKVVPETCLIASNTSSLSITEMQSVLRRPERALGLHFFNPVHRMPLVEIVRGEKTSDEAVAEAYETCKKLGKTPIVVKDGPGFLVNRILAPYMNEAAYCLMAGVPVEEIDQALLAFGMPMGPMELMDEVGLDVAEKVSKILFAAFPDRMQPAPLAEKLVGSGRLGKKNGKGLYLYEGKNKEKSGDPELPKLLGVRPRWGVVAEDEIMDRCVLPMVNEASRCLAEGIVSKPDDVDLGMIMGTGFPPFRGGLLRYADSLGAKRILARLRELESKLGPRFRPSDELIRRADQGRAFADS